ncbi:MAG TPA: Gfo/Idh/MocA family oxidoreductase [Gaiella sp.]|jgi:predicted dehydrogenase|nr:Gfo/Idh/MocA family oxidoreductase [Gaiella sp.]
MSEPLRVAVVGLGYWGPNLLRNLVELGDAEVVTMCDTRDERLEHWGRRYPAIERTTSYMDVLSDDRVEAVVIATPVATHFELASRALRFGKHTFVEKPLAGSSEEAEELFRLSRHAGRVLMPGHTFLYSPPVVLVKELIDRGDLGEIYFISSSRVNLGLHQADVSVVWDLGPHDFSILRYWLGESPESVSALSRACVVPDMPDVAFINLRYPSGAIAQIELAWLAPSKLRRTAVVGSERMVVYDDASSEPVRVFNSGASLPDPGSFGEYQLSYRTGDIVSPQVAPIEPLYRQMEDFCAAVRQRTEPRSSARLGLEVVQTIEAVDRSLQAGGSPASIRHDSPAVAGMPV